MFGFVQSFLFQKNIKTARVHKRETSKKKCLIVYCLCSLPMVPQCPMCCTAACVWTFEILDTTHPEIFELDIWLLEIEYGPKCLICCIHFAHTSFYIWSGNYIRWYSLFWMLIVNLKRCRQRWCLNLSIMEVMAILLNGSYVCLVACQMKYRPIQRENGKWNLSHDHCFEEYHFMSDQMSIHCLNNMNI